MSFSKRVVLFLFVIFSFLPLISSARESLPANNFGQSTWEVASNLNEQAMSVQKTDPNLAEKLFKQAIEKDPTFYYTYNNLGILLSDNGRQGEAFVMYQKALQIKPDYAKAYNNLGVWYFDSGNKEKALEIYKKSISIDQTDPNPWGNIGIILDQYMGKTDEAKIYYKADFVVGRQIL
jgi:tetratricopeptide (TPR) repeat protein